MGYGKRRRFRESKGLGWEGENVCPAEGVVGAGDGKVGEGPVDLEPAC